MWVEFLNSKAFIFILGVVAGTLIFFAYDHYTDKLHFERYSRISDSLRSVIAIKDGMYQELVSRGEEIDTQLVVEKSKITYINPTQFIRPEITNSDSAYVFLLKFIGDGK